MITVSVLDLEETNASQPRTIGELSAATGLEAHVLRYWESVGLLKPRRVAGRRVYTDDDVSRVAAIQRGKAARLSLEQLREIMTATDRSLRIRVLRQHRDQLRQQVSVITEALQLTNQLLDRDQGDLVDAERTPPSASSP